MKKLIMTLAILYSAFSSLNCAKVYDQGLTVNTKNGTQQVVTEEQINNLKLSEMTVTDLGWGDKFAITYEVAGVFEVDGYKYTYKNWNTLNPEDISGDVFVKKEGQDYIEVATLCFNRIDKDPCKGVIVSATATVVANNGNLALRQVAAFYKRDTTTGTMVLQQEKRYNINQVSMKELKVEFVPTGTVE